MDHTTLIDQILEIERSARAISDETLERQARMEEDLAAGKNEIMEKYMIRARKKLDLLAQSEQEKKERTLATQDARLAEAGQKMEQAYARYGDNWVDTLFHQVVDVQ